MNDNKNRNTMNIPKYKVGQKLLMIYGGKHTFKITGVYYNEEGKLFYSYKNWWGWGNCEREEWLEERIITRL